MAKMPPTMKTRATTEVVVQVRGAELAEAARGWIAALKPKPKLSLSEWSAQYAKLDSGKKYRAFPFQDGIADAFTDPETVQITVKKSSRIGYSQIVQNYIGWCIHQSPRRLLIYQPTIDDAEKYSRDDLDPVLHWPIIRTVAEFKPRDRNNQIRAKRFKGGWIQIKGANSPKEFRRVTTDSVLLEEPDGYPASSGTEGDPARLAFKRCLTSDIPLKAAGSTPTIEGASRIDALFKEGTQEHRYVPCPSCGEKQVLVWGDGTGPGIRWEPKRNPTKAWYCCVNGCVIEETDKAWMDENGEWRAHNPSAGPRHRSFHIWSAYSQHDGAAWLELAREFMEVHKDPNLLKTFVNQVLGDVWAEKGEAPEWKRLYDRREPDMELGTPPAWAGSLTGSIDVQRGGGGRLELDIWAWGPRKQRAFVEHIEIEGAIADAATWAQADEEIAREWVTADGRSLKLARVAVDTGDGASTMEIYAWARRHPGLVMAIKGRHTVGISEPIAGPKRVDIKTAAGRVLRGAVKLWTVGTSMLKQETYGWLGLERPVDGEDYPEGYIFLPMGTSDEWCQQLVAEQFVTKNKRGGGRVSKWEKTRDRNEALDNAVYARAAAYALGVDRWSDAKWAKVLGKVTTRRRVKREPPAPLPSADAQPKPAAIEEPTAAATQPRKSRPKINPLTGRPRGSHFGGRR